MEWEGMVVAMTVLYKSAYGDVQLNILIIIVIHKVMYVMKLHIQTQK